MVSEWMFGVLYHWYGSELVTGALPVKSRCSRALQCPKFGKLATTIPTHAQGLVQDGHGLPGFLEGLAEDHVIEAVVRVVRETLVEVAVVDGHTLGHRLVHLVLDHLDAGAPHLLGVDQHLEEDAFAAAQVEHPRSDRDDVHDEQVVPADPFRVPGHAARHAEAPAAGPWSPGSATPPG